MSLLAGKKLMVIAAIVLGVGLISFSVIQYIRSAERDKIELQLQETTNERREKIRDAIESNRPSNPSDATDSLQYLLERQERSK